MAAFDRMEAVPLSDTMACPNCSASVPTGASFCTSCGHNLVNTPAAAPAPSGPDVEDTTRVDTPGLHDHTQVIPEPAPPPAGPASWSPPQSPGPAPANTPWSPAPADAPAGGSTAWAQPGAAPPAATWQQPAPPAQQGWGPPGPASAWGGQPGGAAAPAWQTTPTPQETGKGSPLGGLLALLGGVAVLAGLFTPWITGDVAKAISGWDLTSGDTAFKSNDPYALLALGAAAIVIGILLFSGGLGGLAKLAAIAVGVATVVVCVIDWMSITDVVKDKFAASANVSAGFGFYLTIAGGTLAALAGLLALLSQSRSKAS